ncbi:MAG: hypothetical protein K2X99_01505 [Gemmatimonadaceae bacterium]|nr:hypothetical protein [Gemmatimonadaceae bacterium]
MLALAACNPDSPAAPTALPFGVVFLEARKTTSLASSPSGFVLLPSASFYSSRSTSITDSRAPTDSCTIGPIPGTEPLPGPVISAGDLITIDVNGSSHQLRPVDFQDGDRAYVVRGEGIPYAPGDSIRINIPGKNGGFPLANVSARTAEGFTLGPMPIVTPGQDLPVTWSPAGNATSMMIFRLRYATEQGTVDEEINCKFKDTGSAIIRARYLTNWSAVPATQRAVRATRLRSASIATGPISRIGILSTFTVPTP